MFLLLIVIIPPIGVSVRAAHLVLLLHSIGIAGTLGVVLFQCVLHQAIGMLFLVGRVLGLIEIGHVDAGVNEYVVDLAKYPSSKFYKFVVKTPSTILTRWLHK